MMQFRQDSAVTSLSFFSNLAKAPLLVSAGENGSFCLWDLRGKCLRFQRDAAHVGAIHSAFFLPGRFQLLTAGNDNSLRVWGIDEIDGSPRELKSRCGHAEGASLIEFYGFHGVVSREGSFDGLALNVLSAGEDRAFRTFHVLRDPLSGELSQGPAGKRQKLQGVQGSTRTAGTIGTAGMQGSSETTGTAGLTGPTGPIGTAGMGDGRLPRITCFAYSEGREKDWANVVTCHEGSASVLVSPFPR